MEYPATPSAPNSQAPRADGLVIDDLEVGTGDEVVSGTTIVVHYVGTLTDGSVFDSSRERARPFSVTIGKNYVIRGWEEGLLGMRVGGIRRLTIPPELGYGAKGHPPKIPENSTLIFEIELLGVE
ncbi:MAG: FKBP-type peptidyl-prolyl cis-trans isomerase [Polyangiaceae bacterium]|nr:FKBP-type peptidyl-prolyl cis-trans isomerase [Myxococcales bacterium]MCB9590323.1 FKBP-type peptidyl-prolyl cis-trans isomerase [Polyangiaceae bacterium]MCB9605022.1 FKBP-type peptidyl-prolyl cis-trans isomerase [Polyangiaceae bacterium]